MELAKWFRLAWDRVVAIGLIAVGAIVLVMGWIGVSGQAYPAKQLPFIISGGVGGIFILGVGALFWLSGDVRDEWTKLDRIEEALTRLADTGLVDTDGLPAAPETNGRPERVQNLAPSLVQARVMKAGG